MTLLKKTAYRALTPSNKGKWVAIALTVLAGFAVFFSFSALFNPVPVVVAKTDIEELSLIQADQLELIKVAKRDCQKETYQAIEDVTGQVAATHIFAGQQVIKQQLKGKGNEANCTLGNIKPHQTMLTLTTQQAIWPSQLRVGDLVTVVAVYPENLEVREEAIGRIIKPTTGSIVRNLKSVQEAQSTSPNQTEVSFVTDMEAGKRILLALKNSQMVYLMPRHPELGGVD